MISHLRRRYGPSLRLNFYQYARRSRSRESIGKNIVMKIDTVDEYWFKAFVSQLPRNYELALLSNVTCGSDALHIPMIDFLGKHPLSARRGLERNGFVAQRIMKTLFLFDSGKSWHGYSTTLLSEKEWRYFTAGLLLANLPGARPFVDWRWVGHRLMEGFASLRWSSNAPNAKYPTLIHPHLEVAAHGS